MAHVADYKKKVVKKYVDLIKDYPIVGAVNMEGMPAPQLQKIRSQIRDSVVLIMSKRRLIKIAFDKAKEHKKGVEELVQYLEGMPALLFTKENPFKLYKMLQKSKSSAPAKAGQTAPKDIVINAGPTPFAPGPVIGELAQIGIKTSVEGGKIAIKEDAVVAKKGDKINDKVAEILTRLGIKPMEVGLDLVAIYENGSIFKKDILEVDESEYLEKLSQASTWGMNLAVEIGYATKDTIEIMLSKAYNDSKALALSENIMADAVVEELLAKAEGEMLSLKGEANIDTTSKPVEKKDTPKDDDKPKEAPKVEEKKKEQPKVEEQPLQEEKKEETPKEEPKVEEKPAEKPKEVPKVKEKSQDEKTIEETKKVTESEEQDQGKTEDIYDDKQREQQTADGEISPIEEGFVEGEEKAESKEETLVKEAVDEKKLEEESPQEIAEEIAEEKKKEEMIEKKVEEVEKVEKEFKKEISAKKEEEIKEALDKSKNQTQDRDQIEQITKKIISGKPKEVVDEEIAKMVTETKNHSSVSDKSAEDLIEDSAEEKTEEKNDVDNSKKEDEMKKVEDLAKEMLQKGTLRK